MLKTLKVSINSIPDQQQVEIIIALLSEIGYHAFEELDNLLIAYIDETLYDENELNKLSSRYLHYSVEEVENRNWNAIWESEFLPVIIDDYVAVRADFHPPVPSVKHDIVITPKMSFGTAHHATTYLMIEQMRDLDFRGKQVLDFGTGTGILAILASLSGANEIVAIDNDINSIVNATENILVNKCENITVSEQALQLIQKKFDIILANINLNVLLNSMTELKFISRPGIQIILSGFLTADTEQLIQKCTLTGFTFYKKTQKDGWICLQFHI